MSLTEITIVTVAGGEQTLRLQDYEDQQSLSFWGDSDKAISGKLRHNMRGIRGRYRIAYELCIQPSEYRSVINNIVSDLTSGQETVTIIQDGDYRTVVPTDRFLEQIEYRDTVGTFVPTMEFEDAGLNRLGGQYVETGYVTDGYVD